MPVRWSAIKVSEAMDAVERQINLADAFFAEAKEKAEAAAGITKLPVYMTDRIRRLVAEIGRIDQVRGAINDVRKSIPEGAIEAERERTKGGSQQEMEM